MLISLRVFFLYLLAIGFIIIGVLHFLKPDFYLPVMPRYLPYHLEIIYVSGFLEIICGLMLIIKRTQTLGAWLAITLFIALYPINIQMAQDYWLDNHPQKYLMLARLLFQFVLFWWAYQYTKPIKHAKIH